MNTIKNSGIKNGECYNKQLYIKKSSYEQLSNIILNEKEQNNLFVW